MKRLIRKKQEKRIKVASQQNMTLKWFISKTGIYYSLVARKSGRQIQYSILSQSEYDTTSLYDGTDYERAFQLFCELSIAIKGVSFAEDFAKTKDKLQQESYKLIDKPQDMTLKMKPLFLGDSDLAIC